MLTMHVHRTVERLSDLCTIQVRLLETLPGFVPAIKTFLAQWQPNVAVFMVSTRMPLVALGLPPCQSSQVQSC